MKLNNVYIETLAYQDPDVFLSSEELEEKLRPVYERLRLPEGRLELSTGIISRGYFNELKPSGISSCAGEKALGDDFDRASIDLLIHSSVCRDFLEPSTASVVHANLKLDSRCASFDLSNACLGFLDAMKIASQQIEAGQIENALIVSGENSKPLIFETIQFLNGNTELTRKSIKKYFANLTIGSAGVAFLLTSKPRNPVAKLLGGVTLCDTSHSHLCQGNGNTESLMMETESEELLKAGIDLAKKGYAKFTEEILPDPEKIIGHQVGIAHRNLLLESLEIGLGKDFTSFEQYGNTGSAACPLTLIKAKEAGFLKKGDKASMLGIGSGLHVNMQGLEWL